VDFRLERRRFLLCDKVCAEVLISTNKHHEYDIMDLCRGIYSHLCKGARIPLAIGSTDFSRKVSDSIIMQNFIMMKAKGWLLNPEWLDVENEAVVNPNAVGVTEEDPEYIPKYVPQAHPQSSLFFFCLLDQDASWLNFESLHTDPKALVALCKNVQLHSDRTFEDLIPQITVLGTDGTERVDKRVFFHVMNRMFTPLRWNERFVIRKMCWIFSLLMSVLEVGISFEYKFPCSQTRLTESNVHNILSVKNVPVKDMMHFVFGVSHIDDVWTFACNNVHQFESIHIAMFSYWRKDAIAVWRIFATRNYYEWDTEYPWFMDIHDICAFNIQKRTPAKARAKK